MDAQQRLKEIDADIDYYTTHLQELREERNSLLKEAYSDFIRVLGGKMPNVRNVQTYNVFNDDPDVQ
jgi:hypothetical protein